MRKLPTVLSMRRGLIPGLPVIALLCTGAIPFKADGAVVIHSLWYNGDFDLNDAEVDQNDVPINFAGSYVLEKALVYDQFVVPAGQTWTVTSLYANEQMSYYVAPTKATWEIRSGMSTGSGGTLVFSGDTTATATLETAADYNNYIDPEYLISTTVTGVTLSAGTYWMAIAPDSAGYYGDQAYIETTSGANAVGTPSPSGTSFINNNLTGAGVVTFAPSTADYSAGIVGTSVSVPETAALPLLVGGVATALGLSRRKRVPSPQRA